MGTFVTSILAIFAFIGFVLYIFILYNGLVTVKQNIERAWGNIDVLLKQRHDELPKLIDVCRGYMKYEQDLLERLTTLRSHFASASHISKVAGVDSMIRQSLQSLYAVAENYPDLKANEQFLHLQKRISLLESQIADRRELFNESVNNYNIRIRQIPDMWISRFMGNEPKEMFRVDDEDKKDIDLARLRDSRYPPAPAADEAGIRQWLKTHENLLASFDRNQDSKIDLSEQDDAMAAVKRWADLATKPESLWHVYLEAKIDGPFHWIELKDKIAVDPFTFINAVGETLWIPYVIVDRARMMYHPQQRMDEGGIR